LGHHRRRHRQGRPPAPRRCGVQPQGADGVDRGGRRRGRGRQPRPASDRWHSLRADRTAPPERRGPLLLGSEINMTIRNYANVAQPTSLTSDIGINDTTLPVVSTAGYPSAPFTIALERGEANEEVVLV